ncbi:MAG: hypothetical protein ACI9YM_001933 [Brevundimonas sp.]|jgi:hypothetical protein
MWKRILSVKVLAIAASIAVAAPALAYARTPSCPVRWGEPGRPLVSTAKTAKAVFLAVEADFFPNADSEQYPEVTARDEGEWWTVFRWRPPEEQPDGSVLIFNDGGQLSLRIAKCDAKITEVWFAP